MVRRTKLCFCLCCFFITFALQFSINQLDSLVLEDINIQQRMSQGTLIHAGDAKISHMDKYFEKKNKNKRANTFKEALTNPLKGLCPK